MERKPTPESATIDPIADQRTRNGPPRQQFADRAAGSDTAPGGVTW